MKRLYTLALGAVLTVGAVSGAFAQEAFPDTPENHWAYEALANMRAAGLLTGYPDGLYRGGRPASRYEMAVALHALYQYLNKLANGYDARIKALESRGDGVSPDDIAAMKQMLQQLKEDQNAMKAWADDIANLKKMAATFEKELASMGVDIEALKKGLNDLAERVSALEKRKPAVDIHGNVGLWIGAGYADDDYFGITVDGRPVGVSEFTGAPASSQRDLNVLHEATFVMSGTNDEGPKWKAALSINNMFGESFIDGGGFSTGFGNLSSVVPGAAFDDTGNTDVYFQEFNVSDTSEFVGQKFSYKIGRVGHQVGSYFMKRGDNTPYYASPYFDDGNWYFDGAVLNFNFGNVGMTIFGGRQAGRNSTGGNDINPMGAGQSTHIFEPGGDTGNNPDRPRGYAGGELSVDQHVGVQLMIPISNKGGLNLNYILFDSNSVETLSSGASADRVNVLGGDVNFKLGVFNVFGGYSQSNVMLGDSNVIDEDNTAWWAGVGYERDNWGLQAGYRSIDPLFYAPGSWGRVGIWWNPTDIEGAWVKGWLNLGDRLTLAGSAEMYNGRGVDIAGGAGLGEDDDLTSFKLDLMYKVSDNMDFWVGTEIVNWDLAARASSIDGTSGGFAGGETDEQWFNIGLKYRMNDKAWWSLKWQISDYDSNGTAGMNPFPSFFSGASKAKGGFITSTLGIKF